MTDEIITESGIFKTGDDQQFNDQTLKIFRFQADANPVYHSFIEALGINPLSVTDYHDIPFLPISFFRDHDVYCGLSGPETTFLSSGTTGMTRSRHSVASLKLYEESYTRGFRLFYGDPREYAFIALLPSYADREGSSLVHMVKGLIHLSGNRHGGFFLDDTAAMLRAVDDARRAGLKVILIGVTFALLDLAEAGPADLSDVIIMETGGMKGRRREIIREELHGILSDAFKVKSIHSEYGMTELLSQAYSAGQGLFTAPPWMKILIRDSHNPLSHTTEAGSNGGISIIDLANIWSCSFIATSDLGKITRDGRFEVTGRFDNSDIRGCNLLVS